ncbi:MAG: hypothetical protein AVDCRST_MAG25-2310 [uncultured Rubrobacteraceae bacterium]|uniref:Uncharacterized protein n=1 Tax=uncultured Rubrobacteraceae bacterium TaxID=349277 RepID=A0A6J4RJ23_9ACTN|nr:MAG: hypothetical protein AVDCRST_MAG25-2310 [uncultured Rubrobacteraceae bacterium]
MVEDRGDGVLDPAEAERRVYGEFAQRKEFFGRLVGRLSASFRGGGARRHRHLETGPVLGCRGEISMRMREGFEHPGAGYVSSSCPGYQGGKS